MALRATTGSSLLLYEGENGAVRAALRYKRTTLRRVEFALDVINASDAPLLATIYAVVRNGQEIPLPPYSFWVDARTDGYMDLPLSWLAALTTRAISVRLQGRTVHQRLEAAMPRPSSLVWFAGGVVGTLAVVAMLGAFHPSISRLDVPASAIAGTPVHIAFDTRGIGTRSWEIDDVGGARVAGGPLASGAGTIAVRAPRTTTASIYDVRVTAAGPFGTVRMSRPLVVQTPRPALPAPRIVAFSLDRGVAADGGTIIARYRVSAQSGTILALDALGAIVAQTVIHGNDGSAQLALPYFGSSRQLQVRLVVRRGAQLATAAIGLEVAGR